MRAPPVALVLLAALPGRRPKVEVPVELVVNNATSALGIVVDPWTPGWEPLVLHAQILPAPREVATELRGPVDLDAADGNR